MAPVDIVTVSTLSKMVTKLKLRLRSFVVVACRVIRSHSVLLGAHVSDCVNSLTASPLRNVPRAAGYPVLGILPQMCNQGLYTKTMETMFELAEDCGLSCSYVGTIPIVYLRDPAIIRQVFAKNTDSITRFGPDGKGPFGINQRLIGYTAATADGDDWHRWRNGFLRNFNNPKSLESWHQGILRVAQRHVGKMIDAKSGTDLRKAMEAYAIDTAWLIALGVDNVSASSGHLVSALARYGEIVGNPSHLWRHAVRNLLAGKSFREPDNVEQYIRDDIDTAVKSLLSQNLLDWESKSCRDSLLMKLSASSGGSQKAPMTDEVLAQARQIFSLGHDASSLALFWAIFELGRHPHVIRELRSELRGKGSKSGAVDFDSLRSMPYLDAVVTELLRLHPPISTTARRVTRPIPIETRNDDIVVLPRGTQLFSSVHLLHRDRQVWGETADDFRPERWLGINVNSVQNRCEYLPFLAGPRACPSSGFVLLQVKTMLAVLLSRADVEIMDPSGVEKCIGGVIRPARPVGYQVCEVKI